MEFSQMEGITDHHRREVGVNLTGGKTNSVEICEKILGAPSLDAILAAFVGDRKYQGIPFTSLVETSAFRQMDDIYDESEEGGEE